MLILPTAMGFRGGKKKLAAELIAAGWQPSSGAHLFNGGASPASLGAQVGDLVVVGMPYNGTITVPSGGNAWTRETFAWMYNAQVHMSKVLNATDVAMGTHTLSSQDFPGAAWAIFRGPTSAVRRNTVRASPTNISTLSITAPAANEKSMGFVVYATDRDTGHTGINTTTDGYERIVNGTASAFTGTMFAALPAPLSSAHPVDMVGFQTTYEQAGCIWELLGP